MTFANGNRLTIGLTGKSGGERAAVQTLREIRARPQPRSVWTAVALAPLSATFRLTR